VLKIEPGKIYRSRNGQKAALAATHYDNPVNGAKVHCPFEMRYPGGAKLFCRNDGRVNDTGESQWDIVDEWREPAATEEEFGLYRGLHGEIAVFQTSYAADNSYWTKIGSKKVKIVEGEFA
jgi:hypothetical protein